MKKATLLTMACFLASMLLISLSVSAQKPDFENGSVWRIQFIKTKANMGNEYLNSLKANWKAINDEAVKQGLILSHKILNGTAANPDDFDIMLMVEFKNMAALDNTEEKWDAIRTKVLGANSEDVMKTTNTARVNVREVYGGKLMREVIYK